MPEWRILCSHTIWTVIAILLIPMAVLKIGYGFYQLGSFPKFNHFCKKMKNVVTYVVDEITEAYYDCPVETVLYVTAIITVIAVAMNKITTL